jgi:glucosylceramidase
MEAISWRFSNESNSWTEKKYIRQNKKANGTLSLDGREYQKMNGFGGCFNELGYKALQRLGKKEQDKVIEELFDEHHCHFNLCRLPIGANDYSFDWYSLDDVPGDYHLDSFSIDRDKKALIPYIKMAMGCASDLQLFASPWSPPAWMKNPPVYNSGKLVKTSKNLKTYAQYFVKFLQAYKDEGITINQIHVQNEPVANQKFPSCLWTGEELRDFIKRYLGPELKKQGISTELWLGTINAPGCDYKRMIFDKWATEDYDYFANTVLSDPNALKYITGVSYQWGGKIAIQRTFESWWPKIRLMQSENECGLGDNTWEYARYVWTMLKHYICNGAESYAYWNMILEEGGVSTWGDPQNAMITIDNRNKVIFNPDFYVMKHFSSAVQREAIRLGTSGSFSADSLVFRNPDASIALELFNPFKEKYLLQCDIGDSSYQFELDPQSVNSILLKH